MAEALGHPQHGYYVKQRLQNDPLAAPGDFITAPEISQVFGELLRLRFLIFGKDQYCGPMPLETGSRTRQSDAGHSSRRWAAPKLTADLSGSSGGN